MTDTISRAAVMALIPPEFAGALCPAIAALPAAPVGVDAWGYCTDCDCETPIGSDGRGSCGHGRIIAPAQPAPVGADALDFPDGWRERAHSFKGALKLQAAWADGFNACRDIVDDLAPAQPAPDAWNAAIEAAVECCTDYGFSQATECRDAILALLTEKPHDRA